MLSQLPIVQLLALIIIAFLYASFDLFNKRNVPDVFAYASVIVGVAISFVFNSSMLVFSFGLALIIGIIGYTIYRLGFWGAGDYFELVAISLMVPLQPAPLFGAINQLGLPFILSVFIATGFAATAVVPIYYLFFTKAEGRRRKADAKHIMYGVALLVLYLMFFILIYTTYGFNIVQFVLMLVIAVPSAATIVFEEEITERMVRRVYPKTLEDGDIIALNRMSVRDRDYFISKYNDFGRLVTKRALSKMKGIDKKLPVYKNAAPLAFFILIGVVVSLLFGNIILFIV